MPTGLYVLVTLSLQWWCCWTARIVSMTVACYLWEAASRQGQGREREGIRRWLEEQAIAPNLVEWYSDRESGNGSGRPELDRLLRDIARGKISTVVLWKLSHLFPRFREGVPTIAAWCERGIRLVVVSQGIDLGPAVGTAVSPLLQGLAKTELEFRRHRQSIGIAAAKIRGVYSGRKSGSTKQKPQRALALRAKGYTAAEIAEALGVSKRTAFRYLGLSRESEESAATKGAKS
jgi:DNA invertase Pin-like site-specific DNA recombinase